VRLQPLQGIDELLFGSLTVKLPFRNLNSLRLQLFRIDDADVDERRVRPILLVRRLLPLRVDRYNVALLTG